MIWIVANDNQILGSASERQARMNYIKEVTSTKVSPWDYLYLNGKKHEGFIYCESYDGINATFITAHIMQVEYLCSNPTIAFGEFVVANTCIWEKGSHKRILRNMMRYNPFVTLWFANQSLSIDIHHNFRQTNILTDVGLFGFKTSVSERKLYRTKKLGIRKAIELSFSKISPIEFVSD